MLKKYMEEDIKLNNKQKLSVLFLVIAASGIFGWIYEVIFYFFNSGMRQVYMRGANFLPWINIYAYGSILIILLTYRYRKYPLKVFLLSMISTGILEFFSGYILYDKLGWRRCWDYNQEIWNFGNIGGFVCLRSVLFFGLSGLFLMYGMIPLFIKIVQKVNTKKMIIISTLIMSIFVIDDFYNLVIHNFIKLPKASEIYKSKGIKYIYFER